MRAHHLAMALVGAALLAACDEPGPTYTDEDCSNGRDDDGDGLVDCRDLDCRNDELCVEDCSNGRDDDGNGLVDCDDPRCGPEQGCVEDCWNGRDDDHDLAIDCADPDCAAAHGCGEVCDDGADDDGDGLADCFDPECEGAPGCGEVCGDGEDDDDDGLADCLDPECDVDPACAELCNGEDDDGDGLVDEAVSDEAAGEPCYGGPEGLAGVGACALGRLTCFDGALVCMGWTAPLPGELCNGLDDDCDGLVPRTEVSCSTSGETADTLVFEVVARLRDVDVQVNLDETGSMGEEIAALRTDLSEVVEAVRRLLPTAAFGVSSFGDFPVGPFGAGRDRPFALHQRVTARSGEARRALAALVSGGGGDSPESGLESLYQIATGAGTSWPGLAWLAQACGEAADLDGDGLGGCDDPDCFADPACAGWFVEDCEDREDDDRDGLVDCDDPDCADSWLCGEAGLCPSRPEPGLRAITLTEVEGAEDVDAYAIALPAGATLVADLDASRAGSGLDPVLVIRRAPDGAELARSRSFCGDDPRVAHGPAASPLALVLEVSADALTAGFYALHVTVDGDELVAEPASCEGLEVGGSPFAGAFFDPALAVPLVPASSLYPRIPPRCEAGCEALLGDPLAEGWIRSFCVGPPSAPGCGDLVESGEEQCDDGNRSSGDGCDWACRLEPGPACGDGVRDRAEECDDGNRASGDGCTSTCRVEPGCGNGFAEQGEPCDDGGTSSGDGCGATCTIERVCGDGVRVPGEGCDDGGASSGDGCSAGCVLEPSCGNAALDPGETCDDGGTEPGDGCGEACALERVSLPAFDGLAGFDPGSGQGLRGGAGFRAGSLPVVVHVTDAESHGAADYDGFLVEAHDEAETLAAIEALGARVVALWASRDPMGSDPRDLRGPLGMASASGAAVRPCAFDGSPPRASGLCGEAECCTGPGGAGRPPIDEGPGCPLAFEVADDGAGLVRSLTAAIEALARQAPVTLAFSVRDVPGDRADGRCFVRSITVTGASPPFDGCGPEPLVADSDGDGHADRVEGATAGTRVGLQVVLQRTDRGDVDGDGDRGEPCGPPGSYGVFVDLVAEGGALVGSQLLEVVVP